MTGPQQDPRKSGEAIYNQVDSLSDREAAFITRWVAITHPDLAEQGLLTLAAYKRNYPDQARQLFGAWESE